MGRGRPRHDDILTPREWQVLRLVRDGLTNEEIAERLGISFAAAKYHVAEILSKLGVSSRHDAVQAMNERKRGPWAVLPFWPWPNGVKYAAVGLAGAATVIALVFLAGVGSLGDTAQPEIDALSVGADVASEAKEANDRAQQASPYMHTILFTKTAPQNVGKNTGIIASMRTVGSLPELRIAISLSDDINLIVVDQSAVDELTGGDFLYQQIKAGRAIIELNTCLGQVHYRGDVYSPSPPSPGGRVTETSPDGTTRTYEAIAEDSARVPGCIFADRWEAAGAAYFGVRRASTNEDAVQLSPGQIRDTTVNITVADREQLGLFESAVRQLDADPYVLVFPGQPDCETARRDGAPQGVSVNC